MSQTRARVSSRELPTQCPHRKPGGELLLVTLSKGIQIKGKTWPPLGTVCASVEQEAKGEDIAWWWVLFGGCRVAPTRRVEVPDARVVVRGGVGVGRLTLLAEIGSDELLLLRQGSAKLTTLIVRLMART